MTNKEKLIAIIGKENFRKLERNFDPNFDRLETLDELIECRWIDAINYAFKWHHSPEGHGFWQSLHEKVSREWKDSGLSKISPEEQDLLFKMFCMEWMEYPWGDSERWYNLVFSEGVGLKIYEALRSE